MATILNDIGLYKNELIKLFLDSTDICECLQDGQTEPLSAQGLLFKQVFPYLYVHSKDSQPLSYLGVEVDIPKLPSRTVKDVKITIWAYCHKDIIAYEKAGYSGTRADILADMIDRRIMISELSGIGTLNLQSAAHITPGNSELCLSDFGSHYHGIELIYTTSDFRLKR